MAAVFVHGVPDTHRVWDGVRRELTRDDVVVLSLPGFGSDLPAGFMSTKEEYVAWLIAQLQSLPQPIDLVGHDWGCILTARVASLRPDLIRTWAAGSGPISAAYEWHPLARIWQTPGHGEEWMGNLNRQDVAALLCARGLSLKVAGRRSSA
jgi:pimeloyl-ACP methyl ester carboxylesterase